MLRIISLALLVVFLSASPGLAGSLVMKVKSEENVADYGDKLKKAIKSELAKNSDTTFNVITVIPKSGKRRYDKRKKKSSTSFTSEVIGILGTTGVNSTNINSTLKYDTSAEQIEIHIYVK